MNNFHFPIAKEPVSLCVVSPSYSPMRKEITRTLFDEAIEYCTNSDIGVFFSRHSKDNLQSSIYDIQKKQSDLVESLHSTQFSTIISSCGGQGAIDVLSHEIISTANIAKKYVVGMSDTSILLNAITYSTGLITIYGIDFVYGFGKYTRGRYFDSLLSILNHNDLSLLSNFNFIPFNIAASHATTGRVIGGCLSSFVQLDSTQFNSIDLVDEDFVLFLEDIAQTKEQLTTNIDIIRRNKGFQKYCKGIVLGTFNLCTWSDNLPVCDSIALIFTDDNLPVFLSSDFGHGTANMPLPLGSLITVDTSGQIVFTI